MVVDSKLIDEVLDSTGGREEFVRKSGQYSNSVSFAYNNREELREKYGGNWIAVHHSEVVAHAKEYHDLENKVKQRKLPVEEVVIKFMSNRRVMTLF